MPPGKSLKLATCGETESEGILKNLIYSYIYKDNFLH